jgi:hypothetical protein
MSDENSKCEDSDGGIKRFAIVPAGTNMEDISESSWRSSYDEDVEPYLIGSLPKGTKVDMIVDGDHLSVKINYTIEAMPPDENAKGILKYNPDNERK